MTTGNSSSGTRGQYDSGNGMPAVRRKDWQFMQDVAGARVTVYDFP